MKLPTKETIVYHNNRVFHPTGKLMFYTHRKKIDFYLKNNLAEITASNEDGTVDILLNFEPGGLGCVTEFDLAIKLNRCVVSGAEQKLTQHHIIPYMFSKFFPDNLKNHNSHDVLLITRELHSKYEREANLFKDELAKKYGIKTLYEFNRNLIEDTGIENHALLSEAIKAAYALWFHEENIPEYRIKELKRTFIAGSGLEPSRENYKLLKDSNTHNKLEKEYGEFFVPFIPDITEFCVSWRQHFIDTMKPKYLPFGWSVNGNVK